MKQQNSFLASLKNVIESKKSSINGASPPSPLPPGTYVWCAWVYDDLGVNIIASTREIPFKVYQ